MRFHEFLGLQINLNFSRFEMATTQLKLLPDDSMSSTTDFCTRRKSASATMSFEQNLIYGSEKSCRHRKISLCNTPGTTSQSNHGKNNKVRITEPHSSSSCSSSVTSESGRSTPQDQFSTNHKKSCKVKSQWMTIFIHFLQLPSLNQYFLCHS